MAHDPVLRSQIRALAWQLSSGEISWDNYRERRAKAVDAILRGEQTLEYKPPVINDDPTTPKHHDTDQVLIDVEDLERPKSRLPAMIALAVLALVIMVAGWVLWKGSEPPVVASAPVVEMAPAESLLDSFLRGDDWSATKIDALRLDWESLDADARNAVRSTVTWRRLQSQIRENINQNRILSTVDETGEARARLDSLMALQRALSQGP